MLSFFYHFYLEFTSEPYDIAATVVQLAAQGNLPLCAVQYAVLNEPSVPLEKYAYLTLCRYYQQEADAQYFKTREELREEINALYVLPVESWSVKRSCTMIRKEYFHEWSRCRR